MSIEVSIIMPVRNAAQWLNETFESLTNQIIENINIELSIYDDGSSDESLCVIEQWRKRLELKYKLIINGHEDSEARGVGYGKNRAVQYSSGRFLCFQDADDLMCPNRIHEQYRVAINENDDAILIGSKYERIPEGSTDRYTQWANNLNQEQLYTQIYLAHGPTVIMPTWFCSRSWFDRLGGFDEIAKGHCEDLTFFFKHLRNGGRLHRADKMLLYYRYHPEAATFSVHEDVIWSVRIQEIQSNIINNLEKLTIWNAGKQGRKFYRSLNDANKRKVMCFCDMDPKKISKGFYTDELSQDKRRIPVIHFTQATPPIIICVKLIMTKTQLLDLPNELFPLIFQYLNSRNLIETFSNVQSNRIQILIQPFISHLDISQETNQWIQTYLPDILNQQNVVALRLHDKQITLLLQYVLLSKIQSMHIFDSHWSTDTLKQGLDQFGQRLKRLSITFTDPCGKGDLASHLFQRYCQLEYVNITGRSLFFDNNEISTCTKLTYLSIELEGMHRVFILMKNLPNLQQLKVKFRVEERMIQPTCYFKNLISCNTLRRITFTGCTKYFEHLAHFFATFGSTIQCLTINIDLIYNVIDGLRLERELLNKMQCLASFDLIIHSILTHRESIEINTFQTLSWRKFNPIVYWNDIHAHQHTIFTLPYRSNTFKHLSNDFQSTCASNREVFLYFERVRTLSLLVTTPLTLETFEFIAKSFPNIKTLELTNPIELSRFELKHNRTISLLSDVFLSNNTLQLPSIVKFCFLLRSHYDNYQILRRFLHLLPNLVYLQMFIGRSLFHEILKYEHEDNFIRSALNRIETLQMVNFYDGKNILTHEEIHNLFPNAKKLFSGR
ncbi:unnamed protein product [Rotaria magnacalcarata]|uniref:F-box domain-containing protein n=1 Tax=Rotaria magnacalcarata TaxID=392030 RepID=A0A816ML46_9BILA|nr:unnamed protein product [Rotaria magnacalcarata]